MPKMLSTRFITQPSDKGVGCWDISGDAQRSVDIISMDAEDSDCFDDFFTQPIAKAGLAVDALFLIRASRANLFIPRAEAIWPRELVFARVVIAVLPVLRMRLEKDTTLSAG